MENVFLCEKRCAFCYNVRWRPFSFFHFIVFCKYLYFVILRARNKWPLYILCRIVNYHWHFDIFIHIPKRQKKRSSEQQTLCFFTFKSNETKKSLHRMEKHIQNPAEKHRELNKSQRKQKSISRFSKWTKIKHKTEHKKHRNNQRIKNKIQKSSVILLICLGELNSVYTWMRTIICVCVCPVSLK